MINIFRRHKETAEPDAESRQLPSPAETVTSALRSLQCDYRAEQPADGEELRSFRFEYQSGSFVIDLMKGTRFGSLTYPGIGEWPAENFNQIRYLCNRMTSQSFINVYYYSTDSSTGNVTVSISIPLMIGTPDEFRDNLKSALASCFFAQRDFARQAETLINSIAKDERAIDGEQRAFELERLRYLIEADELRHRAGADTAADNFDTPVESDMTLAGLLDIIFPDITSVESVKIIAQGVTDTVAAADATVDSVAGRLRDGGVISADVRDADANLRRATIVLDPEPEAGSDTLRATALLSAAAPTPRSSAGYRNNRVVTSSFLLSAAPEGDELHRRQEFRYMSADAADKRDSGQTDALTDEQRFAAAVADPDIAYCLYHGRKQFNAGLYTRALPYLVNAYQALQSRFHALDDNERDTFLEIAFLAGACYNRLGNSHEAYFYLDILLQANNILWTMEYINALTDANDFRARMIVESVLENIRRQQSDADADELPLSVARFVDFLHRRQAYIYINQGLLDEAETILLPMLEQPDNKDFAIGELAHIASLRSSEPTPPEDFTEDSATQA